MTKTGWAEARRAYRASETMRVRLDLNWEREYLSLWLDKLLFLERVLEELSLFLARWVSLDFLLLAAAVLA